MNNKLANRLGNMGLAALTFSGDVVNSVNQFNEALKPTPMIKSKPSNKIDWENLSELNKKTGAVDMGQKTLGDFIRNERNRRFEKTKEKPNSVEKEANKSMFKQASVEDSDMQFVDGLISSMTKTSGAMKARGMPSRLWNWMSDAVPEGTNAMNVAALLGTGAVLGKSAYGEIKDAVKSQMSYRKMFDEFPELNEMPRTQVDKLWGVLHDFAPKLTINPLVAGQFISNMASFGMRGIDHNIVGQLAQISGNIDKSRGSEGAVKALSGLGTKAFERNMDMMAKADDPVAAASNDPDAFDTGN